MHLGWTRRLRRPNKTLFAVRRKLLYRQHHGTAFSSQPMKRKRAPVETDPPRNSRLRLIRADESREGAPGALLPACSWPHRTERSLMPEKTHAISRGVAASTLFVFSWGLELGR